MKAFPLLFLLLVVQGSFAQSASEIRMRDNFLNNPRFLIGTEKVSRETVSRLLSADQDVSRDFDQGMIQLRTGSILKITTAGLILGGLVYGLVREDDPDAWKVTVITSALAIPVGFVGTSLRKKGYNRVNSSIYRYNYLQTLPPTAELKMGLTRNGAGLSFYF